MLLSVIVPIYQVEPYIAECLTSLSPLEGTQTEILLVDDRGTDGSRAIADSFCARYSCMRVLERTHNGGLSAARNTGLAHAQGDYVFFLDSDDLCDAQVLLHLAHTANEQALDVLKARFVSFVDSAKPDGILTVCAPPPTPVMTGDALFAAQCRAGVYEPMVWQCLYRRGFLQSHALVMPDGFLFEDELFQTPALLRAKRACMSDACLVRYRQRDGSIMRSFHRSADWCAHYLAICRRLRSLCAAHTPGTRQLRRRIGQLALSVGKNIDAYGLADDVREAAVAFLRKNRRELAFFAVQSGDLFLLAQGLLLLLSPTLFLKAYGDIR